MKRAALVVLGLVLAGAAIWGLAMYGPRLRWGIRVWWGAIAASRREPAALDAWRKAFGDPAADMAAHPTREDNATAVRLVALAANAGVNFQNPQSGPPEQAIAAYVKAESMKTGGPVGPPPDAVRSYLGAHQPGLDAMVDLLAQAEPPVWKTEQWPPTAPSGPPLFGVKLLSNVLVARALSESSRGHDTDAERALRAAWQLSVSLRDRPLLIEELIVQPMTTTPAVLARRLAVDPASWRARLGGHDDRESFIRAMVIEASHKWSWHTPADGSQMALAARADYLDLMRAYLGQLRSLSVTAQPPPYEFSNARAVHDGWSAGTIIFMIGRPGFDRAWLSMNEVMLNLELTDRVLEARDLKARLGHWPAAIPGLEASRIAGVHWIYRVAPDGTMSIALSPKLQRGLPLQFESRR